MIIFINVLLLLITGNAGIDWYRIVIKKRTFTSKMYRTKTIIRGSIMLLNGIITLYITDIELSLINLIALVLLQSSIFWPSFDALLNVFRGKKLSYVGHTADSDTFFKNDPKMQFLAKLLFLILSITLSTLRFV